jgi:hypothetical protein
MLRHLRIQFFGYFRLSQSLCFPSLVPCLFSFADDFLVVDVIFYHGSAASFVVFILVRRTPLVNGFLGVWGVWGWGRFLLRCVALHSWMLYIITKSLYCFHITVLLVRWFPALGYYKQETYAPHSLPLQMSSPLFQPARFCFPMLYGVSVRLSTYMKPSSSPWKGWVMSTFPCVSWWFFRLDVVSWE